MMNKWGMSLVFDSDDTNCNGFSLIELMIAMAIASFLGLIISTVFYSNTIAQTRAQVRAELFQDTRAGISFMGDDIRNAGLDPAISDGFGFLECSTSKIRFTSDCPDSSGDYNGIVDIDPSKNEDISYLFNSSSSSLELIYYEGNETSEVSETVVENVDVSRSGFRFFDQDGTLMDSASPINTNNIGAVEVTLTLSKEMVNGPISKSLSARYICKNLYYAAD